MSFVTARGLKAALSFKETRAELCARFHMLPGQLVDRRPDLARDLEAAENEFGP